jgi:hypothetical protein
MVGRDRRARRPCRCVKFFTGAMKLYLETTIPNFLFADDAPEKRRVTEAFFQWLRITSDTVYSSQLTKDELSAAPEPKRAQMLQTLEALNVILLKPTSETLALAELYVRESVIPSRFRADAAHVAIAVCHHLDVIVSWNMRHLVNVRKVQRINEVNAKHGWQAIRIHTPEEVLEL